MRYTRNRQYPVEQRHVDEAGASLHGGANGTVPLLPEAVDADVQGLADRAAEHDTRFGAHANRLTALEAFQAALPNLVLQTGKLSVSFTNESLYTRPITFPRAFSTTPNVFCSIESGSGVTARWDARAFNITASGFTLFCFPNDIGDTKTWSGIPVSWLALTLG